MGRGLSTIQRSVLTLALENRARYGRTDESPGADIFHYEILAALWGWPLTHSPLRLQPKVPGHPERRTPSRWHFSLEQVGREHYASARSSLGRAMRRLAIRGLVVRRHSAHAVNGVRWSGAKLTPAGVVAAHALRGRSGKAFGSEA
jgi:hypothetical protein